MAGAAAQGLQQPGITPASAASAPARKLFEQPAAGTILYSRLVGRVNSDVPGPVIAEIMQGPFSGARLIGSFQFSEEGVIIQFKTMSVTYADDDGHSKVEVVPINAVAVDTKHLGTAMATDIDRHILQRVGVSFASAFIDGLGQAISRSGSTAVYNPYGGTTVTTPELDTNEQLAIAAGAASGKVGNLMEQIWGNKRTTVIVDADTPFGLLFMGDSASGSAR